MEIEYPTISLSGLEFPFNVRIHRYTPKNSGIIFHDDPRYMSGGGWSAKRSAISGTSMAAFQSIPNDLVQTRCERLGAAAIRRTISPAASLPMISVSQA